jgi:hypothetical protein
MMRSAVVRAAVHGRVLVAKNDALAINERVNHATYGLGTITAVNAAHTTIEFDENGCRKFVTSLVQLERSTVAAPVPASKKRARPKKAALKAVK